ncbi:AAA family ATPase [[Actinomadura] parvosata]|uniref:AAA family ATPase n=1 Tax=[Actinomadura] parvosata TaxID=1955412 RepID=UPI00406C92C5
MSIGGDNNGAVLIGDHNIFHYTEQRTIVTEREGGPVPVRKREHPDPRWLPESTGTLIGRDHELARIRGWLAERGAPVLVHGPPGIGKSAVLTRIARDAADAGEDVVYLSGARMETEDIVQELFEACYDSPGYLPPPKRLRALMGKVRALVVIDGYEGSAESLEQLLDATPGATLLLSSTRRLLGAEGHVLPLGGLAEPDAIALTMAEAAPDKAGTSPTPDADLRRTGTSPTPDADLRRTGTSPTPGTEPGRAGASEVAPGRTGVLSEEERAAIRELCRAANGHPRTLLQAAALMRTSGVQAVAADPDTAARALVASLDGDRSAAVRALAALPGVPVPAPALAALAGLPSPGEAESALAELRRLRLAERAGPGHVLAGGTPVPRGRHEAAGYATRLAAWLRTAPRADVTAGAAVFVAVLRAAVSEEAYDPARALARAAAPLLGRSLRWGAWGQVLALGLTAAANAGAADDAAYFESEEKARKRALGLLLGLGGGGAGAAGAVTLMGKGGSVFGSLFSGPTVAVAVATTVAVTAAAVIGVRLASPSSAADPSTVVVTPAAAGPQLSSTTRPPVGTVQQPDTGQPPVQDPAQNPAHNPGQNPVQDPGRNPVQDPGRDTARDQGRNQDQGRGRDPVIPRPGTPRLALTDTEIESGGSTGARATGFEAGERITFSWAGRGSGGELGVQTADGKGAAVLPDAVPAGIAAGQYTITAQGASPDRRADAALTVRERPAPHVTFVRAPSSVQAEAVIEVVAEGFDEGETVRLTVGDATVATAPAGGSGRVTLRGDAPANPAQYRLTVTGRAADRSAYKELTVTPKPPPDLSGRWGGYLNFRDVGGGSYEGTRHGPDWVEPNSGCTYPSGGPEVHLSGQAPTYQGEIRWIYGTNGENCDFEWGAATFTLGADGDTLAVRSEDPRDPGHWRSTTLRRN